MSFEIVHPEKPTEQDKIDDNDYMLPHSINGVLPDLSSFPDMKARIPILIEEKNLTNAQSTTFSNLNGDQDKLYYIELKGSISYPSGNPRIFLYPNNDTGNKQTVSVAAITNQTPQRFSGDPIMLLASNSGSPTHVLCELTLHAETGKYRKAISKFTTIRSNNEMWIVEQGGFYTETATNITRLDIVSQTTGHLFTGTIKLYKLVDINLEDLTPT